MRRSIPVLVAATAMIARLKVVHGDVANIYTWTGQIQQSQSNPSGTTSAWNWDATASGTLNNWSLVSTNASGGTISSSANAVPISDGDTRLIFSVADPAVAGHFLNLTPYQDLDNNGAFLNSVSFNDQSTSAPADSYTLNGGPLALTDNEAGTPPSINENTASPQTINEGIVLSNSALFTGTKTGTITITGPISQASTSDGLTISGSASYILSGTDSFTGPVVINSGASLIEKNALAVPGNTVTINTGGTLDLSQVPGTAPAVTLNSLAGGGNLSLGATALTVGGSDAATSFSGVISGNGGTLIKIGNADLILNANTYTGGTQLSSGSTTNAGALGLASSTALGTGALSVSGTGSIFASGADQTIANPIVVGGPNTLNIVDDPTTPRNLTLNGVISGTGTLQKQSTGTLTLGGKSTFTGTLALASGNTVIANTATLTPTYMTVGSASNAMVTQSGNLTVGNELDLGISSGTASYTIGSNVTLSLPYLSVDEGGSATLTQSSGTISGTYFTVGGLTISGDQSFLPGTATFNMSGGSVREVQFDVADFANGVFTQTGGSLITTGQVNIAAAYNVPVTGTAVISGSTSSWSVGSRLRLGSAIGGGSLTIKNGASVETSSYLELDKPVDTVNVSAGTLTAVSLSGLSGTIYISDPVGGPALKIGGTASTQTFGGNIADGSIGPGSFTKIGTNTQILSGTETYTGMTTVSGGTLEFATGGKITGPITITAGSAGAVVFDAAGSGGMLKSSAGAIVVNSSGLFTLASPVASVNRTLLNTPSITVNAGGTFDEGSNDLDLTNETLATANASIAAGYNGGAWNGEAGISSTTAAAVKHLTALGVIANNQSGTTSFNSGNPFDGTIPAATDVLVKYTYYGDANLDGKVDGSDYSRIDAAYLADKSKPSAATGWFNGDFNYDGVIDGSDYTLIDNAFNTQGSQLSAQIATPTAQLSGSTETSVPEPATLGPVAMGIGLLGPRKRKSKPKLSGHQIGGNTTETA